MKGRASKSRGGGGNEGKNFVVFFQVTPEKANLQGATSRSMVDGARLVRGKNCGGELTTIRNRPGEKKVFPTWGHR